MTEFANSELAKWAWKKRMLSEQYAAPKTVMIRLSFRPRGDLPFDANANKREYPHVRKWFQRWKKKHKHPCARFIAIAELGSQGKRLHYHVLVHGCSKITVTSLRNSWKQGQTHGRTVENTGKAANYVAKYIGKDGFKPRTSISYGRIGALRVLTKVKKNETIQAIHDAFPFASIASISLSYRSAKYGTVRAGIMSKRMLDAAKFDFIDANVLTITDEMRAEARQTYEEYKNETPTPTAQDLHKAAYFCGANHSDHFNAGLRYAIATGRHQPPADT